MAAFMGSGETARALDATRVSREVKLRLVDAGLGDLSQRPLNLAKLLVAKGRTGLAPQIAAAFAQLVEEHQGIARARVITAVPLSDRERDAIAADLRQRTGRNVVLDAAVDPALLGGIVVQIGDRLIDGSTRARLEALKRHLVGAVA